MDATTAGPLIDNYLAAYTAWASTRGNNDTSLKNWGALMADPSMAGFLTEYQAALNAGCVSLHAVYDPTQLATDLADFKTAAAAVGLTGTLT